MTSYSKFLVGGSEYFPDIINVTKTIGETNAISKFTSRFNNYSGRLVGSFVIGDEVDIYAAKDINNNFMDYTSQFLTQWKFDNNGSDTYGNSNGIKGLSQEYVSTGKIGSCLTFGGLYSQFTLPYDSNYNMTVDNDMSFFCWIYPSGNYTDDFPKAIFAKMAVPNKYQYSFHHSSGTSALDLTLLIYQEPSVGGSNEFITASGVVTKDQWNHVGFTKLGSYYTLYINGSNVLESHMDAYPVDVTYLHPTIGAWQYSYRGYRKFSGKIDDARFFKYIIGSDVIGSIYNNDTGTEDSYGVIYENNPNYKIFSGILEDIDYEGLENREKLVLSGKDYSVRLLDRTVEPETYNNLPAGSIVKDIITKYTDDITTNNVSDGEIVSRIVFNQLPVFDAVKELAELTDFTFYVDNDKDLHFEEKSATSSGYTFGSGGTAILESGFKEKRDELYNSIWVYGDRYLDGYKETFTGDGTGSVYTLGYNPHNTNITVDGSAVQPGGIYEMTYGVGSDVKYLVNFDEKQIIFTSGTEQGDNIPGAGSEIIVNYYRDLPIVKYGENTDSVSKYGTRNKVIQDKTIKDPITAETILLKELERYSDPLKQGEIIIKDVTSLTPGETCVVNIPFQNINSMTYDIISAKYDITKQNLYNDSILNIKLNKKIPDITDTLKDLILSQKRLQGADLLSSDLLTRIKISTGSFSIRQSGIEVWTRGVGSSFILSSPIYGLIGSYANHNLGDHRLGSVLAWSGGYF